MEKINEGEPSRKIQRQCDDNPLWETFFPINFATFLDPGHWKDYKFVGFSGNFSVKISSLSKTQSPKVICGIRNIGKQSPLHRDFFFSKYLVTEIPGDLSIKKLETKTAKRTKNI